MSGSCESSAGGWGEDVGDAFPGRITTRAGIPPGGGFGVDSAANPLSLDSISRVRLTPFLRADPKQPNAPWFRPGHVHGQIVAGDEGVGRELGGGSGGNWRTR